MQGRGQILLLSCAVGAGVLASAAHAQEPTVRVSVYGEHHGGNVVYRYEVRNNTPGELRAFYIGCECPLSERERVAQLRTIPPGAQPSAADGTGIDMPTNATTQPAGWRVQLQRPRDADGHWLAWHMPAARANAGVTSGQSLRGFSITLPRPDPTYLAGTYSAHVLQGGRYVVVTGPLTLLDTTPPTLSLKAVPAGADVSASTVRILASARDDRDPEPRVAVESVERVAGANPEERRYAVSYTATDASGNRATASITIALPAAPAPGPTPTPTPTPNRAPMVQARLGLPSPAVLP